MLVNVYIESSESGEMKWQKRCKVWRNCESRKFN